MASISEFIAELRRASGTAQAMVLRARLLVAQAIETKVQDNIRKTFGEAGDGAGVPRSDMTTASEGGAARNGGLLGSVQLTAKGDVLTVSVGGTGVPYAEIQEKGGVVKPTGGGKYLTIPVAPEARKMRVADFGIQNLEFGVDPIWGLSFSLKSSGEVLFALRRRVTIPARPYFEPAVREVANDATIRDGLKAAGMGSLEVRVK